MTPDKYAELEESTTPSRTELQRIELAKLKRMSDTTPDALPRMTRVRVNVAAAEMAETWLAGSFVAMDFKRAATENTELIRAIVEGRATVVPTSAFQAVAAVCDGARENIDGSDTYLVDSWRITRLRQVFDRMKANSQPTTSESKVSSYEITDGNDGKEYRPLTLREIPDSPAVPPRLERYCLQCGYATPGGNCANCGRPTPSHSTAVSEGHVHDWQKVGYDHPAIVGVLWVCSGCGSISTVNPEGLVANVPEGGEVLSAVIPDVLESPELTDAEWLHVGGVTVIRYKTSGEWCLLTKEGFQRNVGTSIASLESEVSRLDVAHGLLSGECSAMIDELASLRAECEQAREDYATANIAYTILKAEHAQLMDECERMRGGIDMIRAVMEYRAALSSEEPQP